MREYHTTASIYYDYMVYGCAKATEDGKRVFPIPIELVREGIIGTIEPKIKAALSDSPLQLIKEALCRDQSTKDPT